MLLPVLKNFTLTKGVTFDYPFQYLAGAPTSNRPQDLTGYTASMALTSWDGVTTYMTLNTSASPGASGIFFGGDTNTPSNGVIDIVISATDTAAITWQSARYNLALTTPTDTVTRLLYGAVTIVGFLP